MRVLILPLALAACSMPWREAPPVAPAEPVPAVFDPAPAEALRPRARPGEAPPVEPASPAAADGRLGETLAGLGAPGEPGLWLRTGLVQQTRAGRVVSAAGASVAVELRPSGAAPTAGSQISLAALRALGLPLTQLATLSVYAD